MRWNVKNEYECIAAQHGHRMTQSVYPICSRRVNSQSGKHFGRLAEQETAIPKWD